MVKGSSNSSATVTLISKLLQRVNSQKKESQLLSPTMDDLAKQIFEWQRNNTSSDSSEYTLIFDDLPTYLVIISIAGLLTNGVVLYLLTKTKVRNTPNVFIFNLVVADLLVVVFYLPFDAGKFYTVPLYPFGEFMCKATESMYWVSLGATSFSLVVLGAHSLLDERRCGGTTVIVVIWTLAVLFASPTMFIAKVLNTRFDDVDELLCLPFYYQYQTVEVLNRLIVCVAVPLIVVCGFYVSNKIKRNVTSGKCSELALWMLVFCAICIVPGFLSELWQMENFHKHNDSINSVHVFFTCVQRAYPCLNPLALYCVSDDFRQVFHRYMLCWCRSKGLQPVPQRELPLQPLV